METLLRWQFHLVWSLLDEHLATLTEDDVQWAPVPGMWTVRQGDDGRWRPDWIEPEPGDGPPATIGWLTWHIGWWWTEALAAWHGEPFRPREEIYWPGSATAATIWIRDLASRWRQVLAELPGADLDRMAPVSLARPARPHDRAPGLLGQRRAHEERRRTGPAEDGPHDGPTNEGRERVTIRLIRNEGVVGV
jgi:hypothetical protein